MGMARYVVDAVVLEGRSVRGVAVLTGSQRAGSTSCSARYRAGGYEALEPRSQRPRSCPHADPAGGRARRSCGCARELESAGHDCGAATIAYHLAQRDGRVPSRLDDLAGPQAEGLIVPQPQKRPRSSLIRFAGRAAQRDVAGRHHRTGRSPTDSTSEILNLHRRPLPALPRPPTPTRASKPPTSLTSFHKAAELHGLPASLLSDNGAVFTGAPRRGKVLLQTELERLGDPSRTHGPTTPRPAARSSAYTRPSSATWQSSRRPQPPRAPGPARHLRPLLQRHPAPQSPRRPHAATGLQRPHQGQTRRRSPATHFRVRQDKVDKTATSPCATTASSTTSASAAPTKAAGQAPHRRPRHPRHRPRTAS